ncbi:hypothetical protein KW846_27950 [Pseudomonas sp. PDM32]|uniref:hypothetical protein n=1 Tax=Pseudomonas sp. PDM32 TaxID=2854768 RepID=UPI001C479538|nr:hypothetical protein [Pseudomonas sp. PDM32]MBV7576558.1 hypothetical protein [Pseudomonas sp. PDM32]
MSQAEIDVDKGYLSDGQIEHHQRFLYQRALLAFSENVHTSTRNIPRSLFPSKDAKC